MNFYDRLARQNRYIQKIDVRGVQGNFFQGIKHQAVSLQEGSGLEIIQSFDPIPLYEVMEGLGYEHYTEQVMLNFTHIFISELSSRKKKIFRCVLQL